ncbi:uncharacterized protein LAESUDRAFT_723165 [Laetiporus sulphureus 93-53]|uniref:Secreted protein n=1 Tax=Laetiporus sulphureus 93-53 TaxID=1314785 RepID=A0A165FTU9_9APHY|nr:uncharacterized protein LAESUDRAFT_723165 [Laetiporus sulphureus 93-53]KZT09405.1 hypothetical protein LAESUDRAFT_723165 [Laetiporus sulphureus 93-53]
MTKLLVLLAATQCDASTYPRNQRMHASLYTTGRCRPLLVFIVRFEDHYLFTNSSLHNDFLSGLSSFELRVLGASARTQEDCEQGRRHHCVIGLAHWLERSRSLYRHHFLRELCQRLPVGCQWVAFDTTQELGFDVGFYNPTPESEI